MKRTVENWNCNTENTAIKQIGNQGIGDGITKQKNHFTKRHNFTSFQPQYITEVAGGASEQKGESHGEDIAAAVGWHTKYLSAVLNGRRAPKNAESVLRDAIKAIPGDQIKKEES